jgi:hypothetical protein
MVMPSAVIGIVASHAALIVAVVLNVIVGFAVPLFEIVELIPVGHAIVPIVTALHACDPQNINACVVQDAPDATPPVPPTNVKASLVSPAEYPSVISMIVN